MHRKCNIFIYLFCTLVHFTARFTVIGPDHPVTAIMGEDIILPCHLSPKMSAENMEVRWFRSEFTSFVHLYQHGKDEYGQQMPEYHGRTELLKAGIVDGNVALGIVNIRLSDEGQYRCFVQDGVFHEEAVLELKVPYPSALESLSFIANVTLDPDTAHPKLVLSEDRKSVRWADTWQDLPNDDNPERFDIEHCVLGCEGFTSGRHYWEVEVGVGLLWAVGVARESVRRKGGISLNPEEGIWAVDQRQGQYQVLTAPTTPLLLSRAPSRIRVCLDCEQGQVTFIDAGNEAPIFTFPPGSVPGERIRPCWGTGPRISHPSDGLPDHKTPESFSLSGQCPFKRLFAVEQSWPERERECLYPGSNHSVLITLSVFVPSGTPLMGEAEGSQHLAFLPLPPPMQHLEECLKGKDFEWGKGVPGWKAIPACVVRICSLLVPSFRARHCLTEILFSL
uniref:Butyrophilin subfamily 1 member A1-like n=1 Tax=Gopherus agassizii TaxID=38772 RepID=A0A452GYX3_9SAUR